MILTIKEIKFTDEIDWDKLIKDSSTATLFQTKEWLLLWQKYFGGEISLLGIFDKEELIGIASFRKKENDITLLGIDSVLGGELVSDFGDIIIKQGREKEAWKAIIYRIKNQESRIKDLNFIRENSTSFRILKELGGKEKEVDTAPFVELPNTWDEYLASLDRHDRHEIKRKIRRLEEAKAFKICMEGNLTDIDDFFRLMSLSADKKEGFLTDEMKKFFQGIFETFWEKKTLNLCFMKLDGVNIASTLTFTFKNSVYLYNSGYDPAFNKLSPGLTLKAYLIKHAIEDGYKRFEFLRGGEKYKYSLGGKERKLYRFTFNQIS
jgi:CelD/BcsL family acetyltransferase involved in cellulose biosynthesis